MSEFIYTAGHVFQLHLVSSALPGHRKFSLGCKSFQNSEWILCTWHPTSSTLTLETNKLFLRVHKQLT